MSLLVYHSKTTPICFFFHMEFYEINCPNIILVYYSPQISFCYWFLMTGKPIKA